MKTQSMLRRLLAMVMVFAVCLSAAPWTVFAADTTDANWTKVTAAPADWSGTYLLVYEGGESPYVFDGSLAAPDAVNNYQAVTVADGKISASKNYAITIEAVEGGYVIQAASGLYLYVSSNSNKLNSTDNKSTAAGHPATLAMVDGNVDIVCETAHIRFNKTTDQMRFRFYKSGSYANQQAVTLYKLDESAPVEPSEPETEPSEPETEPSEPEVPAGKTATLVTDVATLTAGDEIILVASGSDFALSTTQNGNNRGQAAITKSADGTTVTYTDEVQVITLAAGNKEGTFALSVGNGYLYAASASKNYLRTEETLSDNSSWTIEIAEGIATVKAQGENTRNWLRHNASNKIFACYGSGQADISIYKLTAEEEEQPSEPSEPVTEPSEPETEPSTEPSEPAAPVVSTVAEAKAMASGTKDITVSGTVIFIDGKNVVIQDATGGINLYFTAAPSDIAVGDVIRATGNRGAYNGLEQLTGVADHTKTGTAELPVKEVTIADILADQNVGALESTRVVIKGVTVGEAGSSNIPLTQGEATINLYKAPALEGISAGDTVDIYATIGDFKGYQLRINAAADVVWVSSPEPDPSEPETEPSTEPSEPETEPSTAPSEPSEPWAGVDSKYSVYEEVAALTNGDVVVIYNPGNAKALSSEDSGYYKAGVDAAVTGEGYIASDSEFIEWTVAVDANGVYTFTQKDLKLGIEVSGTYFNLKTNAGEYGFKVEPLAEGSDLNVIYSSALEGSYGHVYLEWYASKTAFSAYSTGADRVTENAFGFKFYKLVREGVKTEEPTDPSEPSEPEVPAGKTATLVTDVTTLAAGDEIILVASGSDFALSTTQNGNNRGQAAITKSADGTTVTYTDEVQVITLAAGNKEGTFALSVGNGYLYAASASKNYLRTEETLSDNSSWTIEIAEGIATVKAQGENTRNWLRHNASNKIFACYGSGQADISIYKLTAEEEPEVPTGVADGKYVIWAPGYNMALSSVYSGFYNTGVAVAMEGGKLTGYTASEVWTVKNNADGTITISCEGGSLAMGASHSSMPLNEVNATWTLESAGDGLWYVKNVARECYIEWYAQNSNWSGYKYINEGSEGMFALQFTPAEIGEEPEVPAGLVDGTYVIWAPEYNKALSSVKGGNYNNGVNVTLDGEILTSYGATEIWTVTNQADGTIEISQNGKKLALDGSNQYFVMDGENASWTLVPLENGLYNVKNTARGNMVEWYAKYSNWSTYNSSSAATDPQFQICFTPAEAVSNTDSSMERNIAQWGGMTVDTNTEKVYGDKYQVGDELDTNATFTAVVNGVAVAPWTKGGNADAPLYYMGGAGLGSGTNDYLQFKVSSAGWGNMQLQFRLRASNSGAGEFTLQYSTDGVNFTNFTTGSYAYAYTGWSSEGSYPVTGEGNVTNGVAKTSLAPGNYVSFVFDVPAGADNAENLYIRLVPGTTKANGSTGAISNSATVRIDSVVLKGSPIVDSGITGYVAVTPNGEDDQPVGTELTMSSSTEGATIYYSLNGGEFKVYDPAGKPTLEALPCTVEVYATSQGKADSIRLVYTYAAGSVANVRMKPNGGSIYISGESTTFTLTCNTEGATIYYMTSADGEIWPTEWTEYTEALTLAKGFGKLTVRAYAEKEGFKDSSVLERAFTERSTSAFGLYFGQLHSHTSYSDGAGTCEEAFRYAANEARNVDFMAVTDHSNSFDSADSANILDGSMSSEWVEGHDLAAKYTSETFVGLYGYEMTWSNGLGHMNTFATGGFQSRTQDAFKSEANALQNYYAALKSDPNSISQFNHPGTTFGDFSDFAHYDEVIDQLITLIEVGNGEGAVGSSGYFPSYEYYTRALDKGWHVAPTNNQDNHKGSWGDANTARTVVLSDGLTEEGIYDALRNYRTYATEDNDLSIYYQLDGYLMGTILDTSDVGEKVKITATLSDPTDSAIGKVEVIVNGGLSLAQATVNTASGKVELEVPADYNYYYLRITQPDGDIAVTAPVWVGKVEAVGISSFTADSDLTIAGQEQSFTMDAFNNESKDLVVESLTFTNKETGAVIFEDKTLDKVGKENTAASQFSYTFTQDGMYTIVATLKGSLNGVEKTYTKDLELSVLPENITSQVIVDGTHYNDYVSGYYKGSLNNMAALAGATGIQVHIETGKITPEMLENCALLIISAPATKAYSNYDVPAAKPFEDEFIAMVADFVKAGGSVVVCGLADYQDKSAPAENHTAAQLNKLLTAIGSTMRVNDDEAYDDVNFSNQNYRLYPATFNMESEWSKGLQAGQVYSQYSGCTVDPGNGTWLVKGFDTTYSIDSDGDGLGGVAKGSAVFLAAEDTGFGGTIFAAGGVFVSDFEVKVEMDNYGDLPYANRTIYENILGMTRTEPAVTPIADVRASAKNDGLGRIFVVEGYVTSGTDNKDTTFFDAIYVQDATGGVTVFPYSQTGLELGTKLRITGYTDAYQGDVEIQILSCEVLEEPKNVIAPEKVSNKDAMDYDANGGQLLQVEGEVVEVLLGTDGKSVSQFVVKDASGDLAKVFIDGYIFSGTTGKNELGGEIVKLGNTVSAVGLLYMHPEGDSDVSIPVLRVRNCDEILLVKTAPVAYVITTGDGQEVTQGEKAAFVSNADFAKFVKVQVDGKDVDPASYTAEEGSTRITLTDAFTDTLAEGGHTITIVSTDGEASGTFTVAAPAATEPSETEPSETEPSETEPSETEPSETEPSETEPSETEPSETEPSETEPSETEPSETEPSETEPSETEPSETEPSETEPSETEPSETEPSETEPSETEPSETEPSETEPSETEPSETEPSETEPSETEPSETEPSETEPSETEPSETEPSETEPSETEPSETEPSETEPSETEPSETEPSETTEPTETTEETQKPTRPGDSSNAPTGDNSGVVIVMAVMAIALAAMAVLLALRKKINN